LVRACIQKIVVPISGPGLTGGEFS